MPKSLATSETRYGAMRRLVSKGLKSGPHKVLKRILNLGRAGTLTDDMVRLNHAEARTHDVDPAIDPGDFMYWFCCHHPKLTVEEAIRYYFWDGGRSARNLASILGELGLPTMGRPVKLLEFASGYGCVTRHIKKNPRS